MKNCERGQPTAADIETLDEIDLPIVYLDWNVFQYLQSGDEATPLLEAVLPSLDRCRFMVPYSTAHLLDATANWERAPKAKVLREMLFVHGVTDGWLWSIHNGQDSIRRQSMVVAADE